MAIEVSFPFRLGLDGRIAVESDPDRQVRQHVESLVMTSPGERVMLPGYGVPLTSMIFEPDDDLVTTHLAQYVKQVMQQWEPGVVVISIEPVANPSGFGISQVRVNYQRGDSATTSVAGKSINTAVISIGGQVSEVVRS